MSRARDLSAEFVAAGDPTGWFEKLYEEGEAGDSVVPWLQDFPNPSLVEWAGGLDGTGRSALVVGCGTGEDAEFLATTGFAVTAFDLAPTAIAAAKRLHAGTSVDYLVADLLALPDAWAGAFDLVFEAYTVQPLFGDVRERALDALAGPVAPGGTLLVVSFATTEENPDRDPATMPWPLTRAEIERAGGPLRTLRIESSEGGEPFLPRWRAEFRRD
jgi:SAM-dependent methyltransferase